MLTEEQAREKWCPMVRSVGYDKELRASVGNRDAASVTLVGCVANNNPPSCRCIASDCMMWRFDELKHQQAMEDWAADNQPVEQGGPGPSGGSPPKLRGYCGLAGKPEAE